MGIRGGYVCMPEIEHVAPCWRLPGMDDLCGCGCDFIATCQDWLETDMKMRKQKRAAAKRRRARGTK